jgi:hypothetical protein
MPIAAAASQMAAEEDEEEAPRPAGDRRAPVEEEARRLRTNWLLKGRAERRRACETTR